MNASMWWHALVSFGGGARRHRVASSAAPFAPSPFRFFGWIVGLAIAVAVIVPFTTSAELANKVGTAAINLAIGIAVLSIVSGVGRSATYGMGFER